MFIISFLLGTSQSELGCDKNNNLLTFSDLVTGRVIHQSTEKGKKDGIPPGVNSLMLYLKLLFTSGFLFRSFPFI